MAKTPNIFAAFYALIGRLLLTRRSRPYMQHALYRWVIDGRTPARPRQLGYAFVVARRHQC
jgi:hypothetical protein